MSARSIAVLDIGKTRTRLLLVDGPSGEIRWQRERDSASIPGLVTRELDLSGIEEWFLQALAALPERERVDALVPVAHGAAAILVDAHGVALAAPDYEDPVFEEISDQYRVNRDPFEQTYSPFLPLGLNLGRQWFFLQNRAFELFSRVNYALLYPQYWAWRLSGVAASEVTSLGCHTDLWQPVAARFAEIVYRRGWSRLMPPLRHAGDILGTISTSIAARTGLPESCRVYCGLHDSNASFLCHLSGRASSSHFTVISSGTWTVLLAHGTDSARLDEFRDMLANVDAFGRPVATARFMGGREYAAIAGTDNSRIVPTMADIRCLIDQSVLALPSFAPGSGPFPTAIGRIITPRSLSQSERVALASLYLALMCAERLNALAARGPVLIDGPLAANPLFLALLASLWQTGEILLPRYPAGAVHAARILCGHRYSAEAATITAADVDRNKLHSYAAIWRSMVSS